jgi:hypothetical protein
MTLSRHLISQRTFMTSFPHSHRSFIFFSLSLSLSWQLNSTLSNSTKRFRVCTRMCIIGLCTRMNTHSIDFSARGYITNWKDRLFSHQPNNKEDEDGGKSGQQRRYRQHKMNAWRLTTRKKGSKWHYSLLCLPTDNKTAAGFLTPVEL